MRKLTSYSRRTNDELIDILLHKKQLGDGCDRVAYDLGDGTIIKLPVLTQMCHNARSGFMFEGEWGGPYCHYLHDLNLLITDDIEDIINKYNDHNDAFLRYYSRSVGQSLNEVFLAQSVETDLFLPMIECGFFECGIFYSIWPKAEIVDDMEKPDDWFKEYDCELEWLCDKLGIDVDCFWSRVHEVEQEHGILFEDCFDNSGNFGVYRGRIVCIDYGLSSSSEWEVEMLDEN